MGNIFEKSPYERLTQVQREKLDELFEEILDKISIDYNKDEIQDIQSAVSIMLGRMASRINDRGIFNISKIHPSGSMVEKSSIWKRDAYGETYIEFDFLAVLKDSVDAEFKRSCRGCLILRNPPINMEVLENNYSKSKYFLVRQISKPKTIDYLFLQELTRAVTSSCSCLVAIYGNNLSNCENESDTGMLNTNIWFRRRSQQHEQGCSYCTVEMSTGILRIKNGETFSSYSNSSSQCSLICVWISKIRSLLCYESSTEPISCLPVHIDFLPALELYKRNPTSSLLEHDSFIVPKACNLDCGKLGYRRSSSLLETDFIVNEMTTKHRKCYRLIKYMVQIFGEEYRTKWPQPIIKINNYYVKNIVLRHNNRCAVSTRGHAECVLTMLDELQRAYEKERLDSFYWHMNLHLIGEDLEDYARQIRHFIGKLISVKETDTWDTYRPRLRINDKDVD